VYESSGKFKKFHDSSPLREQQGKFLHYSTADTHIARRLYFPVTRFGLLAIWRRQSSAMAPEATRKTFLPIKAQLSTEKGVALCRRDI
jgi:hypothetical protein